MVRLSPVVLALVAACSATPKQFTAADRRDIEQVFSEQREAWNRGDLDAFVDGYERSPELVFTSGGEVRRGFDETLARYQKKYGQDRASMGQLTFELIDIRPIGADGAVVLGKYRVTGGASASAGVFSVVFERGAEGWRIVHDHTSVSPSGG